MDGQTDGRTDERKSPCVLQNANWKLERADISLERAGLRLERPEDYFEA